MSSQPKQLEKVRWATQHTEATQLVSTKNANISNVDVVTFKVDEIRNKDETLLLDKSSRRLNEVSTPAAPSAGQGRIWVNTADSKVYFQDDTNAQTDLTAVGAADVLATNNDALAQPLTNLSSLSMSGGIRINSTFVHATGISIGTSTSSSVDGVTIGYSHSGGYDEAVMIGYNHNMYAGLGSSDMGISVGWGTRGVPNGFIIGSQNISSTLPYNGLVLAIIPKGVIGKSFNTGLSNLIAIGNAPLYTSTGGIVLGGKTTFQPDRTNTVLLGVGNLVSGNFATSIGTVGTSAGTSALAVGQTAIASGSNSTALGSQSDATATTAVACGAYANATAVGAVALGGCSSGDTRTAASGVNSLAVGFEATSSDVVPVMGSGVSANQSTNLLTIPGYRDFFSTVDTTDGSTVELFPTSARQFQLAEGEVVRIEATVNVIRDNLTISALFTFNDYHYARRPARREFSTVDTTGTYPLTHGEYFTLYSAGDVTQYSVWFNVTGAAAPGAPGTEVEVDVQAAASDADVALALQLAIDALGDFTASVSGEVVTIATAGTGVTTDTADVSTGFAFATEQQGAAAGTYEISGSPGVDDQPDGSAYTAAMALSTNYVGINVTGTAGHNLTWYGHMRVWCTNLQTP